MARADKGNPLVIEDSALFQRLLGQADREDRATAPQVIRREGEVDAAARTVGAQDEGFVARRRLDGAREVLGIDDFEGVLAGCERGQERGRSRSLRGEAQLEPQEMAVKHARAGRKDSERERPAEERGDVGRDTALEEIRVGGNERVERGLGSEGDLRDRTKRRERHGLLEQLVECGLAELARGPVDRGGGLGDRCEGVDHGDRLREDEGHGVRCGEDVSRREGARSAVFGGHRERPCVSGAGEVDHEAGVRAGGQEAFRVGGRTAQERDPASLERIRSERRDEGHLVIVRGQEAARLRGLVEEVDLRGGEVALLEHGLHVAAEERRRLDEAHGEARGLRHAALPAGRRRKSPAKRATGADAAYVVRRPARAYWRSHQTRARDAAKSRK